MSGLEGKAVMISRAVNDFLNGENRPAPDIDESVNDVFFHPRNETWVKSILGSFPGVSEASYIPELRSLI
jgi:hypothetical protein